MIEPRGKRMFDKALPSNKNKLNALISDLKQDGQILLVVDPPLLLGHYPLLSPALKASLSDIFPARDAPLCLTTYTGAPL